MNSISNFKQKLTNESPTAKNIGDLSILRKLPKNHAFFLRAKMMAELGRGKSAESYAKKSIEHDLKNEDFLDAAEKAKLFKFPELMQRAGEGFYRYTLDWDGEDRPGFVTHVAKEVMREYGVGPAFISEANLRFEIRALLRYKGGREAEEFARGRGRPELVEELSEVLRNKAHPWELGGPAEHSISPSAALENFTPEVLQELEKDPSKAEDPYYRLIELAREAKGKGMEELSVRLARLSINIKLNELALTRGLREAIAEEAEEFGQTDIMRKIGLDIIESALLNSDIFELRAVAVKFGISEQELTEYLSQRIDEEILRGYTLLFEWVGRISESLGLSVQLRAIGLIKDLPGLPCSLNIFGEKA